MKHKYSVFSTVFVGLLVTALILTGLLAPELLLMRAGQRLTSEIRSVPKASVTPLDRGGVTQERTRSLVDYLDAASGDLFAEDANTSISDADKEPPSPLPREPLSGELSAASVLELSKGWLAEMKPVWSAYGIIGKVRQSDAPVLLAAPEDNRLSYWRVDYLLPELGAQVVVLVDAVTGLPLRMEFAGFASEGLFEGMIGVYQRFGLYFSDVGGYVSDEAVWQKTGSDDQAVMLGKGYPYVVYQRASCGLYRLNGRMQLGESETAGGVLWLSLE